MKRRADCHPSRQNYGRGLCYECWLGAQRMGTLGLHARRMIPQAEQEWFCLCRAGPVDPDGLGECARCRRITADRARDGWEQYRALTSGSRA